MNLIADLLERAKAQAGIESDYRLAKVIGITHSAISTYRVGKALPGDKVIAQLCALSGDDAQLIFAQVQESKASSDETKNFWHVMVKRMAGGVSTAFLSVLVSIALIAGTSTPAQAGEARTLQKAGVTCLYIVSITIFSAWGRLWRLPLFSGFRFSFSLLQ